MFIHYSEDIVCAPVLMLGYFNCGFCRSIMSQYEIKLNVHIFCYSGVLKFLSITLVLYVCTQCCGD